MSSPVVGPPDVSNASAVAARQCGDDAQYLVFRRGEPRDARRIVDLIEESLVAGHLLPRSRAEVERHAHRFIVAVHGDLLVACAELSPLSLAVAEVRSLVVDAAWRGRGLGTRLVDGLRRQARLSGFSTLCALTHDPRHFVRLGFSIVPHVWFPEKIAVDCQTCPGFRVCGQHAVALALDGARLDRPGTSHRRLPMTLASTARPLARSFGRGPGPGASESPDGELVSPRAEAGRR